MNGVQAKLLFTRNYRLGFELWRPTNGVVVSTQTAGPEQQHHFWGAQQPLRLHDFVGHQRERGGGGVHQFCEFPLDAGVHQHANQRHNQFQRSQVDELSGSILSSPLAVIPA